MPCVSLQKKSRKFQEESSDLETLLLELGFLCEKDDAMQMIFYTGKEKDEESSLYYCEQRYYAAHISRWVSTDPTWLEDGINLYAYVHGNPISGVDPSGTQTDELNYNYEAYPKPDEVDVPIMKKTVERLLP